MQNEGLEGCRNGAESPQNIPPPRLPLPPPPGPPGPRPNVPPVIGPPPAVAALFAFLPKPKVLLSRKFNEKRAGLSPQLMGISVAPVAGSQCKLTLPGMVAPASAVWNSAKVGRSVKTESLLESIPLVTLNGTPELAIRNGLSRSV